MIKGRIPPNRWRRVLLGYVAGGALLGIVNPFLKIKLSQAGLHPGIATAFVVNVLLPLLAVTLAWLYPRFRLIWVGCFLMALSFNYAGALLQDPQFWKWTPRTAFQYLNPIMVGAAFGCAILGTLMAGVCVGCGRVVKPLDPTRFCKCGYSLYRLQEARCPECGTPINPEKLATFQPPDGA